MPKLTLLRAQSSEGVKRGRDESGVFPRLARCLFQILFAHDVVRFLSYVPISSIAARSGTAARGQLGGVPKSDGPHRNRVWGAKDCL